MSCVASPARVDRSHAHTNCRFLTLVTLRAVDNLPRNLLSAISSDNIASLRDSTAQVSERPPRFLPGKRDKHVTRGSRDSRGDYTSKESEPAGAFSARERARKNCRTTGDGCAPYSHTPTGLPASIRSHTSPNTHPRNRLPQPEDMASQAGRVRQAAIKSFFVSAQGSRTAVSKVGTGPNGQVEKVILDSDSPSKASGGAGGGRGRDGADGSAERDMSGVQSTMPPSKRVKQQGSPVRQVQGSAARERAREGSNPNDLGAYRHAAGSKASSSMTENGDSNTTGWQAAARKLSPPPPLPPPPTFVSPPPPRSPVSAPAPPAPHPPTRTVFPPLASLLHEPTWRAALSGEFSRPYMRQLQQFLEAEARNGQVVYPPLPAIFQAFNVCPLPDVRVVILGQVRR